MQTIDHSTYTVAEVLSFVVYSVPAYAMESVEHHYAYRTNAVPEFNLAEVRLPFFDHLMGTVLTYHIAWREYMHPYRYVHYINYPADRSGGDTRRITYFGVGLSQGKHR